MTVGDDDLHRGVTLCSRHRDPREIQVMRDAVDMLPDLSRERLLRIWCDSKAGATYSVTVRAGEWIDGLDWDIDRAFRVGGGHNGIQVTCAGREILIDPWWPDDEDE